MKTFPFVINFSGASNTLTAPPGSRAKIYGMFLSLGPFTAVSSLAGMQLTGLSADFSGTETGGTPGQFTLNFLPSTTQPVNIPVDFGASGISAGGEGPNFPVSIQVFSDGSDTVSNVQITVWGEFTAEC
jgi:hypothetical protein